jgi:hypothetical protein
VTTAAPVSSSAGETPAGGDGRKGEPVRVAEATLAFEDVNALIEELEAEFGEERILPVAVLPQDCSFGCTDVATCCGTSKTQ